MKSFEAQLRSSLSTNKRAKPEHPERKKGLCEQLRTSVKEKVIFVLEKKKVGGKKERNLHGIKQKA